MNVFEAITTMKITKNFKSDLVDEKYIGLILHVGTHAPTAGNLQEWQFIVVEDDDEKAALSEAALGLRHLKRAPAIIVICADLKKASLKYGTRGKLVYSLEDIGGCAAFMGIAANSLGLGFDLVRSFDENQVANVLHLPEHIRPLIMMPVGYPEGGMDEYKINPFENVTSVNKYGEKIDINFKPVFDTIMKHMPKKK